MNTYSKLKYFFTRSQPPVVVLMYHRIAPCQTDPWQLSVSPENFEQQLQLLEKTGLVMPITDLVEQVNAGKILKPGIVITFDDGYADNYENAKPLLEKFQLPATFFISTKHIGTKREFWWDELAFIFLEVGILPGELNLIINNFTLNFCLQGEQVLTNELLDKHQKWNAYLNPPTLRSKIYMEIWRLLSPLSYDEQQFVIKQLRNWCELSEQTRPEYFSMSKSQLFKLTKTNLFDIGAHTVSHPALANYSKPAQHLEIIESKVFLKTVTGSDINLFAYPSGNYNDFTLEVLREEGFSLAFTTEENIVQTADRYRIGRFQINNWTGLKLKSLLSQWF